MKLTPNIRQQSSNPRILTPRSYQQFAPNPPILQSPPYNKPLQSKSPTIQDIISQKQTNRTIKYDDNLTYLLANDRIIQFQNRFLSDYKKHGTYIFSNHAKYTQDFDRYNIHNNKNIISIYNIGQQKKKLSSAHKQTYKQLKILILQQLTQLLNQHKIQTAQHLRQVIIKIDNNMKKYCTVQFNHQFLSYSYMDQAEKHFQILENRLNNMEKQFHMETNKYKRVNNEEQKQKEKVNKQDRDKIVLQQIGKIRQQIVFIQSKIQNNCYLNNQLRQQMIENCMNLQEQIRQIRDNTCKVLQYQIFNESQKDNQKYIKFQQQNYQISQDIIKIRENIQKFNIQQAIMLKTINKFQQKMQKIPTYIAQKQQKLIKSQNKKEQIRKNSLTPISIPILELTNNQSPSLKHSQPLIQPIKSISLTYSLSSISDFLSPKNKTNKISLIQSLKQINAKSMKYIIDNDNNLMDDMGNYILDDQGNQIKLTAEQIGILKQSKFVKYKQQE